MVGGQRGGGGGGRDRDHRDNRDYGGRDNYRHDNRGGRYDTINHPSTDRILNLYLVTLPSLFLHLVLPKLSTILILHYVNLIKLRP